MNDGRFKPGKTVEFEGKTWTVRELADKYNIKPSVLHKRLARTKGDVAASVLGSFETNKFINLVGKTFGRLTVLSEAGKDKHSQTLWNCECSCGTPKIVQGALLRNGNTRCCGCLHKEITAVASRTHGMSKTPIWSIHRSMMDRCQSPANHAYPRYGGRGIKVCERWKTFENFYADMGERPKGMSLERVDNDGDYCPENVIWASPKTQSNNRRSNVHYTYGDETLTLAQWADKGELSIGTLWSRLERGIPFPICLLNLDLRQMRGQFNAC